MTQSVKVRVPWLESVLAGVIGLLIFIVDDLWPHAQQSQNETSLHFWTETAELLILTFGMAGAAWYLLRYRQAKEAALKQELSAQRNANWVTLGRLAGSMAHEIRNPLHNAHLLLEVLEVVEGPANAAIRKRLVHNLDRIDTAVELIYLLGRPCGSADSELTSITQAVNVSQDEVANQLAEVQWKLEILDEVEAFVNPDRMRIVVTNLMRNAAQVSRSNAPGKQLVTVSLLVLNGYWMLEIRNSGALPVWLQDQVIQPPSGAGGLGLGLIISRQLAEQMELNFRLFQAGDEVIALLRGPIAVIDSTQEKS